MVLSLETDCLTSLYLMLLSSTSCLQQIASYNHIECILFTTHLNRLCRTTRYTLSTIDTTSPITAIANSTSKAMITPSLSSELQSLQLHASVENNTPLHTRNAQVQHCFAKSYISTFFSS